MKIDHIALYVSDLNKSKAFYSKYFGAVSNDGYFNKKTGLRTFFLTFGGDCRLEIMSRPNLCNAQNSGVTFGIAHFSIRVGSKQNVDALAERLSADGFNLAGKPRTTGDGYYEACAVDPDGNLVEIVA